MKTTTYLFFALFLTLTVSIEAMAANWSGNKSGNISGTLDMTGDVNVTGKLTLTGNTVINANGANRIIKRSGTWGGDLFYLNGYNLTINGGDYVITIDGGAVYSTIYDARTSIVTNPCGTTSSRLFLMDETSKFTATNVIFQNQINRGSANGAGIYCNGSGSLNLTGCEFRGLKVVDGIASDGDATRGAVIYFNGGASTNAIMTNCKVYQNYTYGAGCIRTVGGFSGTLVIDDCEFYNNQSAELAPAIHWNAYGSEKTKLTIKGNSKFHNNNGKNGGAISLSGNVDIQSAEFYKNYAVTNGGAIYMRTYNTASQNGNIKDGTHLTISENVSIHDNECGQDGGGVYQWINVYTTTSYGCKGTKNPADFYIEINGGQIYDNVAGRDGGAIYINDETTWRTRQSSDVEWTYITRHFDMSSGRIEGNSCGRNGGAVVISKSRPSGQSWTRTAELPINFTGGDIINNKALNGYGGAFYIDNNTYNYTNGNMPTVFSGSIHISNCQAMYGGAFCIQNSDVSVLNGTFEENTATVNGGVFYVHSLAERNYLIGNSNDENSCVFQGNKAAESGVFYIDGTKGTVTVNQSTIEDNHATTGNAGVFYITGGLNVIINSCTINDNTAHDNGGVLYVNGGNVNVNGGAITHNGAGANGGFLFYNSGITYISGGVFTQNWATNNGGAVYSGGENTTISNGSFLTNNAQNGGAFFISPGSNVTLTNGSIENNSAGNGGGIYLSDGAKFTYATMETGDPGYIRGNFASELGGGIFLASGSSSSSKTEMKFDLKSKNLGFYNNLAGVAADDIYSAGVNTTINIPKVSDMNLGGYSMPGATLEWWEDYKVNDSNYDAGTKQGDPSNITRYRASRDAHQPIWKVPKSPSIEMSTFYDKYLCLTLGFEYGIIEIRRCGLEENESAIYELTFGDGSQRITQRVSILGTTDEEKTVIDGKSWNIAKVSYLPKGTYTVKEIPWTWYNKEKSSSQLIKTQDISTENGYVFKFENEHIGFEITPLHDETLKSNKLK